MYSSDELFFGSVQTKYSNVPGNTYIFTPDTFTLSNDHKQSSHRRLQGSSYLGDEYANLILPSIPAPDLIVNQKKEGSHDLPKVLQKPILKDANGKIVGIQSGVRSGLVCLEGKWYRLKGCGNHYDGFPLRCVSKKDNTWEIRGCTFEHTCHRELYYFHWINSILEKNKLPVSNIPVGWMEYDLKDVKYPKVKRCCAVYQTMSEKRLGDHLIQGLEKLLPLLVKSVDVQKLIDSFPKARVQDSKTVIETFMCILCDGEFGSCVDLYSFPIEEQAPPERPKEVSKKWEKLWDECCNHLKKILPLKGESNKPESLLMYIYWRLGRECGTIQRLLTENEISWGTYEDGLGWHCNSHPNNFAVLPEGEPDRPFLAPMDFDMAFCKKTFDRDAKLFDEWVKMESKALKMCLGGSDLNTGALGVIDLGDWKLNMLRWGLRDTMIAGFESGLKNEKDKHPQIPELTPFVYSIIKLAFMVTENHIA